MKITVGVTTHNRARSLERLMESFEKLSLSNLESVEFVIAVNACTDDSLDVLRKFQRKLPLKIVVEKSLGISYGRNAVVENATGDVMLWTDDDNSVSSNWVEEYAKLFERHPDSTFFGGPIEPIFEGEHQPAWLNAAIRHVPSTFAILNLGPEARPFIAEDWEAPYGANMAMRASVFGNRSFDINLGRVGRSKLSGSEETLLFGALQSAGHIGWWSPKPIVKHWIDQDRQTLKFLKTKYWHDGQDEFAVVSQEERSDRFATSLRLRRRRAFKFWLSYLGARLRGESDEWIPAFHEYNLERGRIFYVTRHGRSRDQAENAYGQRQS